MGPMENPGPKAYPLGARMSVGMAPFGAGSLSLSLFLSSGLWARGAPLARALTLSSSSSGHEGLLRPSGL